MSKNKTLIIKVKKIKNCPNQKEIMVSTNIAQTEAEILTIIIKLYSRFY